MKTAAGFSHRTQTSRCIKRTAISAAFRFIARTRESGASAFQVSVYLGLPALTSDCSSVTKHQAQSPNGCSGSRSSALKLGRLSRLWAPQRSRRTSGDCTDAARLFVKVEDKRKAFPGFGVLRQPGVLKRRR
uniref:Uncharacterized protein n=1 Tax=Knipowitschia caucasica TaxID=637954 RepID=A0AAV2MGW4_KNICA